MPDLHASPPDRTPRTPAPAWLGLGTTDAGTAEFLDRFTHLSPLIDEIRMVERVEPATAAAQDGRITAWLRWATLPERDGGGGLAATEDELARLDPRVLREGAWSWWMWMHSPVRSDHPLL